MKGKRRRWEAAGLNEGEGGAGWKSLLLSPSLTLALWINGRVWRLWLRSVGG